MRSEMARPAASSFALLIRRPDDRRSTEVAIRLGQMSEFSLLVAVMATELAIIRAEVSYLIQISTLVTFVFSSYYIIARYPTPIALDDRLRRD